MSSNAGNIDSLLVSLESLGKEWFIEHNPSTARIENAEDALIELLDRVFLQGRNDQVSAMVREAAYKSLDAVGWVRGAGLDWLNDLEEDRLRSELVKRIGKGKIGKGDDIKLCVALLIWVRKLPEMNFTAYFMDAVTSGRIADLYWELRSIHGIGPKISAFIMRDFLLGLELSSELKDPTVYQYLCPVDIHVEHTAAAIGIPINSHASVVYGILDLCTQHGRDPLLVNQGMFAADKSGIREKLISEHGFSAPNVQVGERDRSILRVKQTKEDKQPQVESVKRSKTAATGLRAAFWQAFRRYLDDEKIEFNRRNPMESLWYGFSGGRSKVADFGLTVRLRERDVTCEVNLINTKAKTNFKYLFSHRQQIESGLGFGLEWHEFPGRTESRIRAVKNLDPESSANWNEIFKWYVRTATAFQEVISPYMDELETPG